MNDIYIYIYIRGCYYSSAFFYYIIGDGTFKDDFRALDLFSFFLVQWCS